MNTKKKNQHYIPKFYLRNFSYQGNEKQIGIFNLKSEFYYKTAKLKTQGSKNFFYGYDGEIEDGLSEIEGILATSTRKIIETMRLPNKNSKDHIDLLVFVALTHLRNPVAINSFKGSMEGVKKRLLELAPNTDTEKFVPEMGHDEIIQMSLGNLKTILPIISDLDYKLLVNKTSIPFISSDFPIVKYNQFLEIKKWTGVKTGYGALGLQIIIPLNPKLCIIFYDSGIYKVGFKKRRQIDIINKIDIDQINLLQFVNCFETIFFNEDVSEHYIRQLFSTSKKYKRANQTTSKLGTILKDKDDEKQIEMGNKNLLIMGRTDCEIKLEIQGVKMHSKGKWTKLSRSMAQLRPIPKIIMGTKNNR